MRPLSSYVPVRVANFYGRVANKIEYSFILTIEGLIRLFYRLDPRIYRKYLRVRRIRDGHLVKAGGKFFVLLVYCNAKMPGFTRNLIAAVEKSPFNLVVVSNDPAQPAVVDALLKDCRLLIERANVGRDFGGYQDAVNTVLGRFGDIERLVIANDSVFYLDEGLDRLVADLDGDHDFIGVSEVYDHHYHIASFMMSFGRRVVDNAAFRDFWRRYRPISSRRWAILKGEGALTDTLLRAGFRPHVLYRAVHLRTRLRQDHAREEISALLPPAINAILNRRDDPAAAGPYAYADAVVEEIMARNQLHAGGFLFRKFLGLPLIKRDLGYREVHSLEQLGRIINDVEPAMRDDVLSDFHRRGDSRHYGLFRKVLHRHGIA